MTMSGAGKPRRRFKSLYVTQGRRARTSVTIRRVEKAPKARRALTPTAGVLYSPWARPENK